MTITARFPGTCCVCGNSITPGQRIEWERGKPSRHTECPPQSQEPAQNDDRGDIREILNSPGGVFVHSKPPIGEAIMVGGQPAIVLRRRFMSRDEAEDFDMFEFADDGGWEVFTRPPATAEEQRACEELLVRVEVERREEAARAARAREKAAREQQLREEQKLALAALYADLEAAMVVTSAYPDFPARGAWMPDGEPIHFRHAGWYDGGNFFTPFRVNGERVMVEHYGNVMRVWAPAHLVETWRRQHFEEIRGNPGQLQSLVEYHVRWGDKVVGGDFSRWAVQTYGLDALIDMTGRRHYRLAGADTLPSLQEALQDRSIYPSRSKTGDGQLEYEVWLTPEQAGLVGRAGYALTDITTEERTKA